MDSGFAPGGDHPPGDAAARRLFQNRSQLHDSVSGCTKVQPKAVFHELLHRRRGAAGRGRRGEQAGQTGRAGKPGARAFEVFSKCFEKGVLVRVTGDIVALTRPLIIESKQITQIVETLAGAIRETA